MTTSNKLLTGFFLLIPLSLFGYNLVLRDNYLKGDFYQAPVIHSKYPGMVVHELPSFSHLVVDGAIKTSHGEMKNFNPFVAVVPWTVKSKFIIARALDPLAKYKVRNDTLFITLEKDKINEKLTSDNFYNSFYAHLAIESATIKSMTLANGRYLFGPYPGDANIFPRPIDTLNLAGTHCSVTLNAAIPIIRLNYSLGNNSKLLIEERHAVKDIHKITADPDAEEIRVERLQIISPDIIKDKQGRVVKSVYNETSTGIMPD